MITFQLLKNTQSSLKMESSPSDVFWNYLSRTSPEILMMTKAPLVHKLHATSTFTWILKSIPNTEMFWNS